MGYFTKKSDKKSGDGLALTEWNDLSNAVGGNSGLTLALNPADNVGIGTNSPTKKLHIEKGELRVRSTHDNSVADVGAFYANNLTQGIGIGYNRIEAIGSISDQDILLMPKGGGKVGVGTASPSEKLHIDGNIKAAKFIGDGSQLTNLSVGINGLNLATNGGNVGIGKASPKEKLHVEGSISLAANNELFFTDNGQIRSLDNAHRILFRRSENLMEFREHGKILFSSGATTGEPTNKMVIDTNGNVGIGLLECTASLDVARGTASWGTAVFRGTERNSHFNYSANEDTYIRGGKKNANVLINNNGGNVGIGTETPKQRLEVNGTLRLTGDGNFCDIWVEAKQLVFRLSKSSHGIEKGISWDGDTNLDSYSDFRLKTKIENEDGILERLMKLDVKNYNWKTDPDNPTKEIGFIAQDVKPLFPTLVGEITDPETKEATMTLKFGSFGILAVGAIKELKLEFDNKVASLENEIADLKKKLFAPLAMV